MDLEKQSFVRLHIRDIVPFVIGVVVREEALEGGAAGDVCKVGRFGELDALWFERQLLGLCCKKLCVEG